MSITLEKHGKTYKVFMIDYTKNDGKNRTLLGTFKTAADAEKFMNRIP